ncbi:chitinase [Hysterangium stoloniferum]|nr:chitinase [Hysterangium stoloniferum]
MYGVWMLLIASLIALASTGAMRSTPPAESDNHNSSLGRRTSAPEFVAAAWFVGWHATPFPVEKIPWNRYTHMSFFAASMTPDVHTLAITHQDDNQTIPEFVAAAHKNNVPVSISIGGWAGSRYMSTAVGSAENRTAFVNTLSTLVQKYNFDGLDFNWEYPTTQGSAECKITAPQDTANFLLLLQELRRFAATSQLILTAAAPGSPVVDAEGRPPAAPSAADFAGVLDYITIMNYNVWGPWAPVLGPSSPLDDACAPGPYQRGSAAKAVAAWKEAGMPADKIVLGVASYGHGYSIAPSDAIQGTALAPYPKFDATKRPLGDVWSGEAGLDICGATTPAGSTFNFWWLVDRGFLDENGSPAKNIQYQFDTCSQTAYVYDPFSNTEVSFDDIAAFTAKGKLIKENSLRGFALWEAGGDYGDLLLSGIRSGAGLQA